MEQSDVARQTRHLKKRASSTNKQPDNMQTISLLSLDSFCRLPLAM